MTHAEMYIVHLPQAAVTITLLINHYGSSSNNNNNWHGNTSIFLLIIPSTSCLPDSKCFPSLQLILFLVFSPFATSTSCTLPIGGFPKIEFHLNICLLVNQESFLHSSLTVLDTE